MFTATSHAHSSVQKQEQQFGFDETTNDRKTASTAQRRQEESRRETVLNEASKGLSTDEGN